MRILNSQGCGVYRFEAKVIERISSVGVEDLAVNSLTDVERQILEKDFPLVGIVSVSDLRRYVEFLADEYFSWREWAHVGPTAYDSVVEQIEGKPPTVLRIGFLQVTESVDNIILSNEALPGKVVL